MRGLFPTLNDLGVLALTFQIIAWLIMLVLAFLWRTPGVPLAKRFEGGVGENFIRPDRLARYQQIHNGLILSSLLWIGLMLFLGALKILRQVGLI